MNLLVRCDLPKQLLDELYRAEAPIVSPPDVEIAQAWLRCALVDFNALDEHIGHLQSLSQSPFRYPPARRDGGPLDAGAIPTTFRFTERLPDPRVLSLLECGVETLTESELGELLLNPFALYDLFDVIDEVHPEEWLPVMHEVGHRMIRREGSPIAVANGPRTLTPAPERGSLRIRLPIWAGAAMAAGLLVAVGATFFAIWESREADRARSQLAELKAASGAGKGIERAVIDLQAADARGMVPLKKVWQAQYVETDSPSENLRRISNAAGPEVKSLIMKMRSEKKPDFEILTYIRTSIFEASKGD